MSVLNRSYILISNEIEKEVKKIKADVAPHRVVEFIEDNFKIENAKAVLSEAYVSESSLKYIILGANEFTSIAQNSLLKLLEEPPLNVEFIIISPTKSNLLPTVRSRLPIVKGSVVEDSVEFDMSLSSIDYRDIFSFLKENRNMKKNEAKKMVEAIYKRAVEVDGVSLSLKQLDEFEQAYKLLELNARPQSVFSMLLMGFVK